MAISTEGITAPFQEEGHVTQEVIPPAVTGADVQRQADERIAIRGNPLAEVGKLITGISGLANGISDAMAPAARAQGEAAGIQSVTRDANGQIQVQPTSSWMFGKSGEEYAAGVAAGTKAAYGLKTATDLNGFRASHLGDPEGFKQAADQYISTLGGSIGAAGTAGPSILLDAQRQAAQHYDNLVTQRAATDLSNSKISLESAIQSKSNDLNQLARQGGMTTPDFLQKYQSMAQDFQSLGAVPQFGYPPERVQSMLHDKMVEFHGSEIVGSMDQAYADSGEAAATKVLHDRVNALQGITDAERERYINQGNAQLGYLKNQNAGAVEANKAQFGSVQALGARAPPQVVQSVIDDAVKLGDDKTAGEARALQAFNAVHPVGLSPAQSTAAQGVGASAGPGPGPSAAPLAPPNGPTRQAQAYNFFIGKGYSPNMAHAWVATLTGESGPNLNTGIYQGEGGFGSAGTMDWSQLGKISAAEGASGIANWNIPRAQNLVAWAHSNGMNPADFTTQLEFAHHEAQQMGIPLQSGQSPSALTQMITGTFERPAINNGAARWANYAKNLGAGAVPAAPSVNNIPFTEEQMRENPYLGSEWVKLAAADKDSREKTATAVLGAIEKGISNNVMPTKENLALGLNAAEGNPKFDEQITRIAGATSGLGSIAAGGEGSPGGLIDQARTLAAGPDLTQQSYGRAALKAHDDGVDALKKDPFVTAAGMKMTPGVPSPIDYGKPGDYSGPQGQQNSTALAQTFGQRASLAMSINRTQPDVPPSALAPSEVDAASNIVSNGSLDQKVALLGAISRLPDAARQATFDALKTGSDGETFAQAGHVATFNPGAAQDILIGMAVLNQEPKFAPPKAILQDLFEKSLPSTDLSMPGARGRIFNAAMAHLAAQNFKEGNLKQDPSKWDQSLDAVTGGVLEYRGTKIIAPVPGNTQAQAQAQFDQRLQGLTDADMHGATAAGVPVPAAALQGSWNRFTGMTNPIRLQTADPDSGKYLVIGGYPSAPQKVFDPATGRAFVLDLGKAPASADSGRSGGSKMSTAPLPPPRPIDDREDKILGREDLFGIDPEADRDRIDKRPVSSDAEGEIADEDPGVLNPFGTGPGFGYGVGVEGLNYRKI